MKSVLKYLYFENALPFKILDLSKSLKFIKILVNKYGSHERGDKARNEARTQTENITMTVKNRPKIANSD